MAQLKTHPVVKCTFPGCVNLVEITHLSTAMDDPSGELLQRLAAGVAKNALCAYHTNMRAYYIANNRQREFEGMYGKA